MAKKEPPKPPVENEDDDGVPKAGVEGVKKLGVEDGVPKAAVDDGVPKAGVDDGVPKTEVDDDRPKGEEEA